MTDTSTVQHTPGPWATDDHLGTPYNISDKHGDAVALTQQRILSLSGTDPERLANSRLIAAAPDLLEAARLAVIELGYVAHAEAESNALPLLRAATAKAEGRNQGVALVKRRAKK